MVAACSSGGEGSSASGGAGVSTGGVPATGGANSGGDSDATGSGISGDAGMGGSSVTTGGSGAGGATTSGGTATGGMPNAGGSTTGGVANAGGSTTGGASTTGDASATGGQQATGGATATGGESSTGGAPEAGGATATGGESNTGGTIGAGGAGGASGGVFAVTSPGWENMQGCSPDAKMSCAPLPTAMTRASGGNGTSPELTWTGAPEGTKSFVVLLQDLSNGTAHWILWNIPATASTLAANVDPSTATPAVPAGSQQCSKDTTGDGYYGPGAPCNVYELVVYALSIETFSPTNATDAASVRTQLQALGSSVLGTATLRGRTDQGCSS